MDTNRTTIQALNVGDQIRVTFAPRSSSSPDDVRTVTVTEAPEAGRFTVAVSSGKVRPGHNPGGAIMDLGGELFFWPTMNQKPARLRSVTRI